MSDVCPKCGGKGWYMITEDSEEYCDPDDPWEPCDVTCDCPAGREKFPVTIRDQIIDVYEQDFIPDPKGVRNVRNMINLIRPARMDKAREN